MNGVGLKGLDEKCEEEKATEPVVPSFHVVVAKRTGKKYA